MSNKRQGDILISQRTTTLYATLEQIREAWALVSENPMITVRQIKCRLGVSHAKATDILKFLERSGYVSHNDKQAGRTPVIPLVTIGTALPKQSLTKAKARQS